MKAKLLLRTVLPLALVFTMLSCSSSDATDDTTTDTRLIQNYDYNQDETQLADLINNYRESIGLNRLTLVNHISYKSEEHNEYMIANNVVNHDFFQERCQNIMAVLGAVKVNENIAYNFVTPEGVLEAWLKSPGHKANIESDSSRFGISVTVNPDTGRKYYTNIFIK